MAGRAHLLTYAYWAGNDFLKVPGVSAGGAVKILNVSGLDVDTQLSAAHSLHVRETLKVNKKRRPD